MAVRGRGLRFKTQFGITARLTAAFVGLAALAAVAGGASSWFSLQSAGIVQDLGTRTLPTVTASLAFAQESAVLVAEAPALASQTDLGALTDKANGLGVLVGKQGERLDRLRAMVEDPRLIDTVDAHNRALGAKIDALKAAAAERIDTRGKIGTAVGDALSRYQDLMDFVRPLQESLQLSVDSQLDALGKATDVAGKLHALTGDSDALRAAMEIQANGNLAFGMLSAVANASDDGLADIRTQYAWAELHLGKAVKAFGQGADAERLSALTKALLDLGTGPNSLFALRDRDAEIGTRLAGLLGTLTLDSGALGEDVKALVSAEDGAARAAVTRSGEVTRRTLLVNALTSAAVIVAALLIGFVYVRRSVTRRLTILADAMGRLAGGTLDVTVPTTGRDEITAMATAVQVFRQTMIRTDALAAETARLEAEQATARAAADTERATAAAQQAAVVAGLAAGLSSLAKGDLTQDLATPFPPGYEQLRHDFNAALEQLRATVSEVVHNADGLRTGTSEIAGAADDLSRRTENQAASLEETAAALGQVTQALRRTAEGAAHAKDRVGHAKTQAEASGAVIHDAVAAMSAIETSSNTIGQIIGVVDEIAFQTNLLALNAGVEAARAGDAGRGFAVVASEVRALAQRSAASAKEIKGLVSSSQSHVSRGVDLVGQGGQALGRMLTDVGEINEIVGEIARAAREQIQGLDQVNIAVTQMDQVTQQNAAMVEETTAASHQLAREIDGLVILMERFRIGDGPSSAHSAPPTSQPRSAGRGRSGGAAVARRPEPDEEWAEF